MRVASWRHLKFSTLERLVVASTKSCGRSDARGDWLIIPPASPGSMGDEAMVQGLVAASDRCDAARLTLMQPDPTQPWVLGKRVVAYESLSFRGLDGWRQAATQICQHGSVLIVGADIMDGYYDATNTLHRLRLASLATRLGTPVTILGCSVSEQMHPAVRDYWRRLDPRVRICARDPRSRDRLAAVTGRPVELVADLAFLIPPYAEDEGPAALMALRRWAQDHAMVLGVNVNPMPVRKAGGDPDRLIAAYVEAIGRLAEAVPGLAVALLPHDVRADNDDVSAAHAVGEAIAGSCPVFDGLVKREISARLMKSAAGCCHCVFTGRMHLAIGALGMGVPVAGIDYLDKFDGLMDHFGVENMIVPGDEKCDATRLFAKMHELCLSAPSLTRRIQAGLPGIRDLVERNFEGICKAVGDVRTAYECSA